MEAGRIDTPADSAMRGAPIERDGAGEHPRWLLGDIAASASRPTLGSLDDPTPRPSFTSKPVEIACGPAEVLLGHAPDRLVASCGSRDELVLMLACASRTLQFHCGGEDRNQYRWALVGAALGREPSLERHHAAFVAFAAVESGREPSAAVLGELSGSSCPSDIHASAHGHQGEGWRRQLAAVMPDLGVPTGDSRIRHVIAHVLIGGRIASDDEAERLFRLHLCRPTAPGTDPSVLRDAVPVLLTFERTYGEALTRRLWPIVGGLARGMGFGQEWSLTEACRVLALLRTGDPSAAREIADQMRVAASRRPLSPGLVSSADLLGRLATDGRVPAPAGFSCLGGSREQYLLLQEFLTEA